MKNINNEINQNILANKVTLFRTNESLNIPARLNASINSSNKVFENYEYPICSWPVLIDSKTSKELSELAITIPKLISQIPKLYFNNDKKQLADFYFQGDQVVTEFALMFHQKNIDVPCRLDLTETQDGFKILEANFGSAIGGWQIHSFEEAIRKFHKPLIHVKSSKQYKSINTQTIFLEFIISQILDYISFEGNEVNVFLGLDVLDQINQKDESLIFFNNLFKIELKKRNLIGSAYSSSLSSLELKDGRLFLKGKEIHSVLLLTMISEKIPINIFRAFMMNKIYFPDHLGVTMLGDKRNLNLLRKLALNNKFKKEENELILNSIPWSEEFNDCDVIYEKRQVPLLKLLEEKKKSFVIKPANGFQGIDVFIGKYLSIEEWKNALQVAITKGGFIVQEFCDSIDYDAPSNNNEWRSHKLIWGIFGFGDNYGGAWVRMSDVKSGVKIINSANGAVEAIVFEMDTEID